MKWKLLAAITAGLAINSQGAHNLTIQLSGAEAEIRWPSSPGGYFLEYKTSLNLAEWMPLMQSVTEAGGVNTVRFPFPDPARFFRLTTGLHVIYVDAANGSDRNSGQITQPVATIQRGLMLAMQAKPGKEVHVANGAYNLNGGTLELVSGIRLIGGFDAANGWTRTATTETFILGGPVAVLAQNLGGAATIEGFSIEAAEPVAAGESSYGILAIGSNLQIRNNIIMAGRGRAGANGASPGPKAAASGGLPGLPGSCDSGNAAGAGGMGGTSECARNGGAGGRGGASSANGISGLAGVGNTLGGGGGSAGNPGVRGQNGNNGLNGQSGANGAAAITGLSIVDGRFGGNAGQSGAVGTAGNGGGGGGGGGGQDCAFCQEGSGNGGGGGGGGGCGGDPGGAGQGGGGSFGIFVSGGQVTAENNFISVQNGGAGGNGGNSGLGGQGGDPGFGAVTCPAEVGSGGNGGRGGNGGAGGAGSGGAGGPSIGIYAGGPVQQTGNQFTIKSGGAGGLGGTTTAVPAPAGHTGPAQEVYTP